MMDIFAAIEDRTVEAMPPRLRDAIAVATVKPPPTVRTERPPRAMPPSMHGDSAAVWEAPTARPRVEPRRGSLLAGRLQARAHEPFTRDEFLVWGMAEFLLRWYAMGKRFVRVHLGGYGRREVAEGRASVCASCPARVRRGRRDYCSASSCGCPQKAWWPFGSLQYMVWVNRIVCPRGLWEGGKETESGGFEPRSKAV